jgi:hypothetical protein
MEQTLSNKRRYLTEDELKKLLTATRKGRYGQRDATLILIMARHGLRVTEAVDLRWDQIDFSKGHLHVRRLKSGIHSVHPIQGDELRALRELKREQQPESWRAARRGKTRTITAACLLLALPGRPTVARQHPLLEVKRTWGQGASVSAYDPKRTSVGNSMMVAMKERGLSSEEVQSLQSVTWRDCKRALSASRRRSSAARTSGRPWLSGSSLACCDFARRSAARRW